MKLNLDEINKSLISVEQNWSHINNSLVLNGIEKDTNFDKLTRERMMSAYEYLDHLIQKNIPVFCPNSHYHMIEINKRVNFGTDSKLRRDYKGFFRNKIKFFTCNFRC